MDQDPSIQQKQINNIVEEHKDILASPIRMLPRFPIKQRYNISLHTPHDASSPMEYSHTQVDNATISIEHIKPLKQQVHNSLQQAKRDSFFSKARSSLRFRFNKSFPRTLTQWGPLIPKGGWLIQVDISGHPPIPLAQRTVSMLAIFLQFFGSQISTTILRP